ncbi:hypothetical protein ACIBG8_25310 [Nonomuraea sp. NPDC050556]|uniref:hypothetical protein n=1 Tax=Nonomuraea sp. NPDC050556 TaxID=3364369 RepID=UPI0037A8AE6B
MPVDRPIYPERQRRRRRWRIVLSVLTAFVLVVGGAVFYTATRPPALTDASGVFGADLDPVMERIRKENERVLRDHPDDYVTIVVLLPMTGTQPEIAMSRETLRHALEGSHVAQVWRNKDRAAPPYVRLLVGSTGPADVDATVAAIRDRQQGEHIVAAAGMGASTAATASAIDQLGTDSFAMVGAVITSDDLQRKPGLVRIAPLNSEEAAAALRFARERLGPLPSVVVKDSNADDSYTRTLTEAFTGALAPVTVLSFDSAAKNPGTVLSNVAESICNSDARTVYYTGRGDNLPELLSGLARFSRCVARGIAVITGDDASELNRASPSALWQDGGGRIQLYYTALAHPADQAATVKAFKDRFGDVDQNGFLRLFPRERLDDGQAIMHHDALLTAIRAVDKYAGQLGLPGPAEVAAMLRSGTADFDGASGHININADGNPIDKRIPVLELHPDGKATSTGWPKLTEVSAPR